MKDCEGFMCMKKKDMSWHTLRLELKKEKSFISLLHLASSLNYTATFPFQTSCKSIWNPSLIQLKVLRRSQLYTEDFWDSFQTYAVLAEGKYNTPSVCLSPIIWYKCSRCKSHLLAGCTEYSKKRRKYDFFTSVFGSGRKTLPNPVNRTA